MNNILDDLFGYFYQSDIKDNMLDISKKSYELEKALLSELNDEQVIRLKKFINLQMEINLLESKESFVAGCKLATKYILQIME